MHLTIESQELLGRVLAGEVEKVIKERGLGICGGGREEGWII